MPSNLDSRFKNFARGFTTPFRALEVVFTHPKLILLSLLPVVVTLFVTAAIIYACLAGAWAQGNNLFQNTLGSYSWITGGFLLIIVGLLVLYFIFHALSILISLIASPFNDLLSEATEKAVGSNFPKLGFLDLLRVFFLDLRKALVSLFFAGCFGVLSLVPVVGFLSLPGFALIHTLTFVTYPQSRRRQGVSESLVWMRSHWEASLGFGLMTLFLFSIPVINFFALPLSVVGGTLLYLENEKSE